MLRAMAQEAATLNNTQTIDFNRSKKVSSTRKLQIWSSLFLTLNPTLYPLNLIILDRFSKML